MKKCAVTSTSTIIPLAEVIQAINDGNEERMDELRGQVKAESLDTSIDVWDGGLLNELDKVFVQHFLQNGKLLDDFGENSAEGRELWSLYHADVLKTIAAYETEHPRGFPKALNARVAILLHWSPNTDEMPFPILSISSIMAISGMLSSLKDAIEEVN